MDVFHNFKRKTVESSEGWSVVLKWTRIDSFEQTVMLLNSQSILCWWFNEQPAEAGASLQLIWWIFPTGNFPRREGNKYGSALVRTCVIYEWRTLRKHPGVLLTQQAFLQWGQNPCSYCKSIWLFLTQRSSVSTDEATIWVWKNNIIIFLNVIMKLF